MISTASLSLSTKKWPNAFLTYFGAFTFAIAGPLYGFILASPRMYAVDRLAGAWFILTLSIIPAAVLVLVRSVAGRLARLLDALVYAVMLLSAQRQIQLQFIPTYLLNAQKRLVVMSVMLIVTVAISWVFRKYITMFMTFLGALSIVLPLHFIWALPAYRPVADDGSDTRRAGQHGRPGNTVFVFVFDELSLNILLDQTGAIDRAAFPNFASFADESVWFRQAIANYPITHPSLNSILTASYTRETVDDLDLLPEPNLLSEFVNQGYKVGVYSPSMFCGAGRYQCIRAGSNVSWKRTDVLQMAAHQYLPQAVQFWLVPGLRNWPRIKEGQLLAELPLGPQAEPGRMSFIHVLMAHFPFTISAEGKLTSFADYFQADFRPGTNVSRTLELYKNQARYLDQQFGKFLRGLKDSGAWERSTVAVTADHGACWKPGCMPRYGRLTAVEPSLARVPMMVHSPSLTPRIVDDDYQNVDFSPTLLDILKMDYSTSEFHDGRAALEPSRPLRRRPFFVNGLNSSVNIDLPPVRVEIGNR